MLPVHKLLQNKILIVFWLFFPIFAAKADFIPLTLEKNFPLKLIAQSEGLDCAPPILSRLQSHQIAAGETIESITARYNLLPETLISLNPVLEKGSAPVGEKILIPPYNGIRVEVPSGATWKDLEAAYGVGADILFETNGCENVPSVVFIPGVSWQPTSQEVNNYTGLGGYPLESVATVGLGFGWQVLPSNGQVMFHSGIDLLADPGTPVLSADAGVVAFVGQEESYGYLVVVDHGGGLQTRYAHLSKIVVSIGQKVNSGDFIGAVGVTGTPDLAVPHLHFEVRNLLPVGWVAQDPQVHFAN